MGIQIKLSPQELLLAALGGAMRQVENIKKGREDAYGCAGAQAWSNHIEGVIGEMVLARFFDVYWVGKGSFRDKDVAGQQVRCAPPWGKLILHPHDGDEDVFWLIRGERNCYVVEGWIKGRDGKQQQWWEPNGKGNNGRAAYFVPVESLREPVSKDGVIGDME